MVPSPESPNPMHVPSIQLEDDKGSQTVSGGTLADADTGDPAKQIRRNPANFTGKVVGGFHYFHVSALHLVELSIQEVVNRAAALARLSRDDHFNVVKIATGSTELSLLEYANFFEDPFPALAQSWRFSTSSDRIAYRDYRESANPPILHKKELLLTPDAPERGEFGSLTQSAEALGLFDEPTRIGFRQQWHELIFSKGYSLVGNEFIPLANDESAPSGNSELETAAVQRHRTALSRYNFSAPVQALSRAELLTTQTEFFDYGCGRGDDVRGLVASGVNATGWDPHYAPNEAKRKAEVVNLGFVINVIEDLSERVAVLRDAYDHATGVLAVAAMLSSQNAPDGRQFGDGYMTSRNTFQKYFTQSQLRDFIEHTLDATAIAAGPGIFLVFRDSELEQRFLSRRYRHRPALAFSRTWKPEKVAREKTARVPHATLLFEQHKELLEELRQQSLLLGRPPDRSEVQNPSEIDDKIGSLKKAMRIIESQFGTVEIESARAGRISDILVMLAMRQFEKRKPYAHLEPGLQLDIRAFFGDYKTAEMVAKVALFDLANADAIDNACRTAAEKGLGQLEDSQSLQLHVSLIEKLPTILRVYISCATVLFGDISSFDLVKIHIRSGKVSLLKFDDFANSPLPRLVERVKVKLREQDMDIFRYGGDHPPTLLYCKSRYINEEFANYPEQIAFEERLASLGLFNLSGYGPPEQTFFNRLMQARWEINGFNLERSQRIPELDEKCGENFTYRQLIECGETQARTKLANLPKEPDTYNALYDLAVNLLDPIIDYFGAIKLTYGFCSVSLAKEIAGRIAPELDQHACHEKKTRGGFVCARLGAAVDFVVEDENMLEVANWVAGNTQFDRLYFYGNDRPIHLSYGPENSKLFVVMRKLPSGKLVPKIRAGKHSQ
jgi:DNA phosphorothioation-associated putative methyltransferase